MNPLFSVPPRVRKVAYWTGYGLGVVSTGITTTWAAVAAASPDVSMPLGVVIGQGLLNLAITQLNLLAQANVGPLVDEADELRYMGD